MEHIPPATDDLNFRIARAEAFRKSQDWDQAIIEYQKAVKVIADDPRVNLGLGAAYEAKAGRDREPAFLSLAQSAYERALSKDPGNLEIHAHIIGLASKQGRIDEIARQYRDKLTKDPENEMLQECVRKITAISYVAIPQKSSDESEKPGCLKKSFEYGMLISGLAFLFISFAGVIKLKSGNLDLGPFRQLSYVLFITYFIYKAATHKRVRKSAKW